MEPKQIERVLDLVAEALEKAPDEREAFLREACAGDEALRREVQSIVDQDAGAGNFLQASAFAQDGSRLTDLDAGELKPGDMLGECRVVWLLGEGGMGEVYLAQDTKLERPVAVKLLKRQLNDDTLQRRFRHERKVLAALTHPNIARLYGGSTTPEGRAYLVMEYVDGERLDRYCDKQGLSIDGRLTLFRKVCAAVAYAHQNLVVHRDLKPANIRVTPEGEPKLLDFGIAKLLDPEGADSTDPTVTLFGAMTPGYASPEQLRGEPITTASDVYSLGVVLYEVLTGERPHQVKSGRPNELVRAVCEQDPARPSTVVSRRTATTNPDIRLRRRLEGDLDNIVAMALRKEPVRRYVSVAQFADDVRRHEEGLPVLARKDTLPYRAGKFVRRHKLAVAAAALLLLALFGGLAATSWQARVATRERDRARAAQADAESARKQAELSRKQSDHLNEFLQKLLTSADPQKMGKDVKVTQVLDAAAKNIDHDLANEPEVLAQAHSTLGLAYSRLQVLAPAEEQSRAALTLFQRLRGDDDPAVVLEKTRLCNVLNLRQNSAEAEGLIRQVTASLRRQQGSDHYALARALAIQGNVLTNLHRTPEAAVVLEESLQWMGKSKGENSTDYLMVLNALGGTKLDAGDHAGAAAIYRRVVDLYGKIAPGNVSSVVPQINLGGELFNLGKFQESEAVLSQAEKDCQRTLGDNNVPYGYILSDQALLSFVRGDYVKSIAQDRRALDLISAAYTRDNPMVVGIKALLGVSLTRTGHAKEGEPFLRDALASGKDIHRDAFARTIGNLETSLGECLLAQERYGEAEPLLVTGYDGLKNRRELHDPLSDAAARRLQTMYTSWNKPEQAKRYTMDTAPFPSSTP